MGKILRIDAANQKWSEEPLPGDDILRKYVGGYGLGVWYLNREVPMGADPLGPDNRLVLMSGPLTGTVSPSSSDAAVVVKNPITGFTVGAGHAHGYWMAEVKFCGFDGVVVQGASENPFYVWIDDGKVEIRDAGHLWGKDTLETHDILLKEHGGTLTPVAPQDGVNVAGIPHTKVASIGPSGENMVAASFINFGRNHHAAKGGLGAVMGSKKLKAVAVHSSKQSIPLYAEEKLQTNSKRWMEYIDKSGIKDIQGRTWIFGAEHETSGTAPARKNLTTDEGLRMYENFTDGVKRGDISIERVGSWNCDIKCAFSATLNAGPFKGLTCHKNGGMEPIDGSSVAFGIADPLIQFKVLDAYTRLGVEAGAMGFSLGLLYECYEAGLIGKDRTGGLELTWGNWQAALELARQTAYREGLGAEIAKGILHLADYIGGDARNRAVQVKGSPINIHDWRHKAVATVLTYAIASAGPRHEGFGVDEFPGPDPDLGYPVAQDPWNPIGKGEAMVAEQNRIQWENSIGCCWFATFQFVPMAVTAEAVSAATGWTDFNAEDAFNAGARATNLARIFNLKNGLTPADDFEISPRLTERLRYGPGKGHAIGDIIKPVLRDYYTHRGWDLRTGRPWKETLRRLGMEEYIPEAWPS